MLLSPLMLALVVALSVALLLFLIVKVKLQPFVALLAVSMLAAFATMPPERVMACIELGMGRTLGAIAVVVGLGAMFGQLLEASGGAERLTLSLLRVFGEKRASWALTLAGFLVAVPVFFDVGFVILVPLVYAFSRRSGRSLLCYGIPLLAGLAVTHAFVPPTPGPIAVAQLVGADLGRVIMFGALIGLPCAVLAGPVFGGWIGGRIHAVPPPLDEGDGAGVRDEGLPGFGMVFGILVLPLLLIVGKTVSEAVLADGSGVRMVLGVAGHPFSALMCATLLAFRLLGTCRGLTRDQVHEIATAALAPAGLIILVTGAGGVFKQVLEESGAGGVLAGGLSSIGMHPIWAAFLIALTVRAVAGSATVAMTTAGGIMSPLLVGSEVEPALVVIAIAAGATAVSHVNDSGFWLVSRYFNLDTRDTLRSWTVMETIIGVTGATLAWVLSLVV